ncbi:MAG: hypothetical protein H6642_04745 [Caldilineaceae bacterium]|nr:hypothetical protein [Caldilineaceae bacterium]
MYQTLIWQHSQETERPDQSLDLLDCSDDLNRLLSAAVVNRHFCRKLLLAPLDAVAAGYNGYQFVLTDFELSVLASIHASSMADFARLLIQRLKHAAQASADCQVRHPTPVRVTQAHVRSE